MRITLNQQEIEQALRQYISSNGFLVPGKTVTFGFTAGRAPNGMSVDIDIVNDAQLAETPAAVVNKPVAPVVSKDAAKPKLVPVGPTPTPAPAPAEAQAEEAAAPAQQEEEPTNEEPAPAPTGKSLFA